MFRNIAVGCLLSGLLTGSLLGADWPMWKYDAGRTANSPAPLPEAMHLQWVRQLPPARQAWRDKSNSMLFFDVSYEPVVAGKLMFVGSMNTDSVTAYATETGAEVWRFYTDGPVRFAPAAYKGKLYVGSDDGYLYCLDASTGKLLWKKRGGPSDHRILGNGRLISMWPMRGAPVIHKDVLYCAAGIWPFMGTFLYALEPETGKVTWSNSGNGSRWITQQHGAPSFSGIAPQGYIAATDNVLLIPSGRSTPGAFSVETGAFLYNHAASRQYGKDAGGYAVSVAGQTFASRPGLYDLESGKGVGKADNGVMTKDAYYTVMGNKLNALPLNTKPAAKDKKPKKVSQKSATIPKEVGRAYIKAGNVLYCAQNDGTVSAVNITDFNSPSVTWQGKIEGNVWTMVAADDRLFVVNRAGGIFCFGAAQREVTKHELKTAPQPNGKSSALADAALKKAGESGGYCVIMGADSALVSQVLAGSKLHIIVVDPRAEAVAALRKTFDAQGLYGDRVACMLADPFRSGLPPYLASALILAGQEKPDAKKLSALFHLLRPYGGLAVLPATEQAVSGLVKSAGLQKAEVAASGDLCTVTRVGSLPGSASWTHQYADAANSVVSKDQLVKPPFGLLWFGGPTNDQVLPRHGHGPNPEVAGGRIFIEGQHMLRALDAYTGRLLWERQLKEVGHYYRHTGHHPGANEIGSNYVSLEDAVYLLYQEKCLKLDPATGKTLKEFALPARKDGTKPIFGSLRVEGDFLVVTSVPLGLEIKSDPIKVKDGKNITLEEVTNLRISEGKDITVTGTSGIHYWKMKMEKKGDKMVAVRDGKRVNVRDKKDQYKIELGHGIYIKSCKSITIAEGKGLTVEKAKGYKPPPGKGIEPNVPYAASSRTLAVLDRHSGKLLWSREAIHGFRHNAVIAAGDSVYCLDKLSPPKENYLLRRGLLPPKTSSLLALDIRNGQVKWQETKDIFGTFLGYSDKHDVLVQAGSSFRDRARDEVGIGVATYRGKDGKMLWKDLERKYSGPLMLRHGEILTNGNGGGAWDIMTGKARGWSWRRNYGCNTAIAGEHVLTFRSGAAGFYDLTQKGGTGNLGGFKSGCSSNLIPGDGLLTAPDYTRTCSCSYQNQTSLALIHMPAAEMWTYTATETPGRLGINFGAPGDRVSASGTLWTEFPLAGSPAVKREVKAEGQPFRHHSALFAGKGETWVGASGVEDVKAITVTSPTKGLHTVRLYFAEPGADAKPGDRVFSVTLGKKQVLSDLDVLGEAGGPRKLVVKEFKGVPIDAALELSFAAAKGKPLICGVEILQEEASPPPKE